MSINTANPFTLLKSQIQNQFGDIRLSVELVPKTCWFSNVRDHVTKGEWDKLRNASYERAGNICEICGGRGEKHPVECHEIWEYDDDDSTQTLKGLISLCPVCHEAKHIGLAFLHGRGEMAKKHLSKANNWADEKTEQYLKLVRAIWLERSKHEWKLNFDWLVNQGVRIKPKGEQ
jgi:hypothetical protein